MPVLVPIIFLAGLAVANLSPLTQEIITVKTDTTTDIILKDGCDSTTAEVIFDGFNNYDGTSGEFTTRARCVTRTSTITGINLYAWQGTGEVEIDINVYTTRTVEPEGFHPSWFSSQFCWVANIWYLDTDGSTQLQTRSGVFTTLTETAFLPQYNGVLQEVKYTLSFMLVTSFGIEFQNPTCAEAEATAYEGVEVTVTSY